MKNSTGFIVFVFVLGALMGGLLAWKIYPNFLYSRIETGVPQIVDYIESVDIEKERLLAKEELKVALDYVFGNSTRISSGNGYECSHLYKEDKEISFVHLQKYIPKDGGMEMLVSFFVNLGYDENSKSLTSEDPSVFVEALKTVNPQISVKDQRKNIFYFLDSTRSNLVLKDFLGKNLKVFSVK